jgi:hypothetical protein
MAHVKRPAVRCKEPAKRRAINDATEARLKEAKAAVNNFPSFAACARHYNVPYDTFCRRVKNQALPKKEAHVKQELLNKSERQCQAGRFTTTRPYL